MSRPSALQRANAFTEATRRLAGRQIVDFYDAFALLGGDGDADLMPVDARQGLRVLLSLFGYKEKWVYSDEEDDGGFRWVRDPWPVDSVILSFEPSVAYRPMSGQIVSPKNACPAWFEG